MKEKAVIALYFKMILLSNILMAYQTIGTGYKSESRGENHLNMSK